ncbi:hypothetical protein X744_05990 [Mesorhizobium sp. LNJC372A00]|nr:hypothetical protein X745_06195 [Mesorhizobium sp. LNJC374B00]ESY61283.1 hypothetical protein X744_05990 [Mesorhizobium sp. LNJC372A00]
MRSIISTVLILLASDAAIAQEAPLEQQRCWLGGMGYSIGSTVRANDAVMVCSPTFVWQNTNTSASGCIYKGEFYSTGAIEGGKDSPKNECQPDGTWASVAP